MEYFTRLSNLFCSKKVNLSNVTHLVVLKVITKVRLSDIEQNKQIFSKRVLCFPLYDPYTRRVGNGMSLLRNPKKSHQSSGAIISLGISYFLYDFRSVNDGISNVFRVCFWLKIISKTLQQSVLTGRQRTKSLWKKNSITND